MRSSRWPGGGSVNGEHGFVQDLFSGGRRGEDGGAIQLAARELRVRRSILRRHRSVLGRERIA